MRAIVNTAAGELELRDVPLPEPGPGQVRVRTAACGICATDLQMIDGDPRTPYPTILGHEWSGVVDAAGQGPGAALIGKRCVAENRLADGGEVGFEHPGGYGEFLVTDASMVRTLPDDYPLHVAALIEPLAVCVHATRRLDLRNRSGAVVLGDGPIGLLMIDFLRRAGVERILVVGGREGRLAIATDFGATATLNYHQVAGDLGEAIRQAASGRVANAIEASGNVAALKAAFECLALGGKLLVLGDYAEARADFVWTDLLHREIELIGSDASPDVWDEAVALAVSGDVPMERLVTQRLPVERFAEGMQLVRARRGDVGKVVLEWGAGQC